MAGVAARHQVAAQRIHLRLVRPHGQVEHFSHGKKIFCYLIKLLLLLLYYARGPTIDQDWLQNKRKKRKKKPSQKD
jgi:hypothetical protein